MTLFNKILRYLRNLIIKFFSFSFTSGCFLFSSVDLSSESKTKQQHFLIFEKSFFIEIPFLYKIRPSPWNNDKHVSFGITVAFTLLLP
jgi:hypothetical protein